MTPATFMRRYNLKPTEPPIPMPEHDPKEGDLRVWRVANIPNELEYYPVDSPEAGAKLVNRLAARDLRNPRITSNMFGMVVYEAADHDWHEWYGDKDQTVDKLAAVLWEK